MEDVYFSYFLGYMLGDGCIWERGNSKYINVASCDAQIIKDLSGWLDKPAKGQIYTTPSGKTHKIYKLEFADSTLYDRLYRHGIRPAKSKSGCSLRLDGISEADFIRGLFDSDGSVTIVNEGNRYNIKSYLCGHISYMGVVDSVLKHHGVTTRIRYENETLVKICMDSRYSQQLFRK